MEWREEADSGQTLPVKTSQPNAVRASARAQVRYRTDV